MREQRLRDQTRDSFAPRLLGAGYGWLLGKPWKKRQEKWTTMETRTLWTTKTQQTPKKIGKERPRKRCLSHGFIWFNIFQPQKMGVESANGLIKFIYPSKHALSDQHVRTLDSFSVLSRHWGTRSILVW